MNCTQQIRGLQSSRVLSSLLLTTILLGLCQSVQAGSSFTVGSFTKTTAGAPVNQNVAHGLGETPKAILLWTNGKTNESFSGGFRFSIGYSDTSTSKSIATASEDAVGTSNAARRIANKALTIVGWDQTLLAEADLSSVDATNFTLNWTTNDATGYVIHFLAVGGSDVSATVLSWTMRTSTGNQSVTGVGFQPDVVLSANVASFFTNTPPATRNHGAVGIGVMDADGDQWAMSTFSPDGLTPSDNVRAQVIDAGILTVNEVSGATKKASLVSMDNDGFTVNFSIADSNATQTFSLALKGINVKPSSFTKSTSAAPASQAITGVGFQPKAVLLTSFQDVSQASTVAHARLGIGGSDGSTEGSSAFQEEDNVSTMNVDGIDKTSKVFVKVDNVTQTIDAEADLTSLDADGFTLNWTTNDAVATEMLYLAVGSLAPTAVTMRDFTTTAYQDGVLLHWKTAWEVDNLGWHVYREVDGRPVRLTPSMIAGSALLVGQGTQLTSGFSYSWWDPAGLVTDRYWIEDVDLERTPTMHGPVSPVPAPRALSEAARRNAPLLHELNRGTVPRRMRQATRPVIRRHGQLTPPRQR